jgi:hypothetical protein
MHMKKLSIVIAILALAGCGSGTGKPGEIGETPKPELKEDKFYEVSVIKSPKDKAWSGLMLHIPEGFTLDKARYERSGDFIFNYKDKIDSFTVKFNSNPGKNDAQNFLEMTIVKPNESAFKFGKMETSGVWSTPFPTQEDTLSSQATGARVAFERKIEETELSGMYSAWWFVAPAQDQMKAQAFSIVISQESLKKDENELAPKFELMKKTMFRLPSRIEAFGVYLQSSDEIPLKKLGLEKVNERLFHLQNGEPFAPLWETLIGKYAFAFDRDRFQMYLVPNAKTPSGLFPHPTIDGWTVDPKLDEWLTDYMDQL